MHLRRQHCHRAPWHDAREPRSCGDVFKTQIVSLDEKPLTRRY
jgi:hypothetical protein